MMRLSLPLKLQIEPGLGELEPAYRQHFLNSDKDQAAFGIGIGIAATLALGYIDYLFFHLSDTFYSLLLIRFAFMILSLATMFSFSQLKGKHAALIFDGLILVWWLMLDLMILSVDYFRPPSYVQNQGLYLLAVFSCYSFFPVCLLARAIPALFLSGMDILILCLIKDPLPAQSFSMILASILLAQVIGILTSARLNSYRRRQYLAQVQTEKARQELETQAVTDELTGLFNRRRFIELLDLEFRRYQRSGTVFTVLMIDFDQFKNINDTYGHLAGDEVLRQFAEWVLAIKRRQDACGRLGGEEFALLLPETGQNGAVPIAGRLGEICTNIRIPGQQAGPPVTISIGISEVRAADNSAYEVLQRADNALYRAKHNGRNRAETA